VREELLKVLSSSLGHVIAPFMYILPFSSDKNGYP
jgi:hypothetical protein